MSDRETLQKIDDGLTKMGLIKPGGRLLLSEDGSKFYLDLQGKFTSMSTYALLALLDSARDSHGEKII